MDKLKPCPFCGYPARLWADDGGVCVMCVNDDCEAQSPYEKDTFFRDKWQDTRNETAVDKVVKWWNRRDGSGS